MKKAAPAVVRKARGGGRWFPAGKQELLETVAGCIESAGPQAVTGRVVAAIAPHAGYVYSGKVAGYTFRAIRDAASGEAKPETVVVLGFSHRGGFPGLALLDGDAVETPLGVTPLDTEALALLTRHSPRLKADARPHDGEHSAENEIPFVQTALPQAKLVVGLFGDHDAATLRDTVAALRQLAAAKRILVIASTDLLHDPDYDLVRRTDTATLNTIAALDVDGLLKSWDYSRQVCCGLMPVAAVMQFAALQGCRGGQILHYRNSGDDFPEGRGQWVVGYGAVVFPVGD